MLASCLVPPGTISCWEANLLSLACVASLLRTAEDVCKMPHAAAGIEYQSSSAAGLRTNVKRTCSQLIRIDGGGSAASDGSAEGAGTAAGTETAMERWAVDSLNVSVATGILLHQLIASARSGSADAAGARHNGTGPVAMGLPPMAAQE